MADIELTADDLRDIDQCGVPDLGAGSAVPRRQLEPNDRPLIQLMAARVLYLNRRPPLSRSFGT